MADAGFDFGGAVSSIISNVGSYFINQQQQKQQMKIAQQMVGKMPLVYPGLGYSAQPPQIGYQQGLPAAYPAQYGAPLPASPNMPPLASLGSYLGLPDSMTGANACSLFVQPTTAPRPRPQQLIMQANPATGRMHFWRHVGSPILYSGDVAHCKTVNRILGRASSRLHRGRKRFR